MSAFYQANLIQRQAVYRYWHRYKSQRYILRTQLGFDSTANFSP